MSKKADEEKLMLIADLIKLGKINDISLLLEADNRDKRISKITEEVIINLLILLFHNNINYNNIYLF